MKLPKELTTVTQLSKSLAVILFLTFPFIGFFLGLRYQEMLNFANRHQIEPNLSIPRTPTLTPDETASWKTYNNEFLGFSIKYPSSVQVSEQKPNAGGFISEAIAVVGLTLPVPTHPANIGVAKGGSITVYKSINDSRIYAAFKKNGKAVKISNYPALYYYETTEAFPIHRYFLTNGGKLYEISTETSDEALDLFNQILSTFKFTQ